MQVVNSIKIAVGGMVIIYYLLCKIGNEHSKVNAWSSV